jgi:hypothetical protein
MIRPPDRATHRLALLFREAATGRFPAADGGVEMTVPPLGRVQAVVAFTAHSVIATSLEPEEIRRQLPRDDLGASMDPAFLTWLGARLGARPGGVDAVLVSPPHLAEAALRLESRPDLQAHPRIHHALRYRSCVRVFADPAQRGVVTLGRGLAGRWEVSLEIDEPRDRLGREMITAALLEVPAGEPVFAQVSPGNARSLRAFLAADFRPICAEVLFLVT